MPMARRRKRPASIGASMSRSSGSPPGSSNSSAVRPPSRASSSGRAAHAPSSSSLSSYSWARRSSTAGGGRSAAGSTTSTALRRPAPSARHPRQKALSPSAHKTCRPCSPRASKENDCSNCRSPPATLPVRGQPGQHHVRHIGLHRIVAWGTRPDHVLDWRLEAPAGSAGSECRRVVRDRNGIPTFWRRPDASGRVIRTVFSADSCALIRSRSRSRSCRSIR